MRHSWNDTTATTRLVASEQAEIALYQRYHADVSYGFYIARRLAD